MLTSNLAHRVEGRIRDGYVGDFTAGQAITAWMDRRSRLVTTMQTDGRVKAGVDLLLRVLLSPPLSMAATDAVVCAGSPHGRSPPETAQTDPRSTRCLALERRPSFPRRGPKEPACVSTSQSLFTRCC